MIKGNRYTKVHLTSKAIKEGVEINERKNKEKRKKPMETRREKKMYLK
jgi:hypothetical protein